MPLVPHECFSMSTGMPSRSGCVSGTPSNDGMQLDTGVYSEPERLLSLRRWLVVGYCFPWSIVGDTLRAVSRNEGTTTTHTTIISSSRISTMQSGHFGYVPATEIQELDVEDGEGSLLLVWARSLLSDLLTERYCLLFNCGEYSSSTTHTTTSTGDLNVPPLVRYFKALCGCKSCVGPSSQLDADRSCMGCGSEDHGLLDVDSSGYEKCPVRPLVIRCLLRQATKYARSLDAILNRMCSKEHLEEPTVQKIPIDKICSSAVQDVTRTHSQKRCKAMNNNDGSHQQDPPPRSLLGLGSADEQGRLIRRVWYIRKRMAENRISAAIEDPCPGALLQQEDLALYMTRLSIVPSLPFLAASELKVQYVEKQQQQQQQQQYQQSEGTSGSPWLPKQGMPPSSASDLVIPNTPCSTTSCCAFPSESFSKPVILQKYPHQWKSCLAHNWPLSGGWGGGVDSCCGSSSGTCLYRHECAFCDEADHGWSTCPKLRENPALRVALHCLYINDVKSGQRAISAMHSGMDSVAPSDLSMYTTEGDSALVPVTDIVLEVGGLLPAPFNTTTASPPSSSTWSNPQFPRVSTDMLGPIHTGTSGGSGSCAGMVEEAAARQLASPAAGIAADRLDIKTPTVAVVKGFTNASTTTPLSKLGRHVSYESLDKSVLRSRAALDELAGSDSPLPNSPTAVANHKNNTNAIDVPTAPIATTSPLIPPTKENIRMHSEVYKYCILLEECRKEEHSHKVDKLVSALPFGGGEFARHLYWKMRVHWGEELVAAQLPHCLHFNSPHQGGCSLIAANVSPSKVAMPPCSSWWWCRLYCDHTCCGVVGGASSTATVASGGCGACDHHLPTSDNDLRQSSNKVGASLSSSFPTQQCLRCGSKRHGWFSHKCRDYATLQQQLILMGVQSLHVLDHSPNEAEANKADSSEMCSEDASANSEEYNNSGGSEYNSDVSDDNDDDDDDDNDDALTRPDSIDEEGEYYEDPDQALGDESSALNDDTPVAIEDESDSFSFDGGAQQDSYESVTTSVDDEEEENYKREAARAQAEKETAGFDEDDDDAVHGSSADVDELAADWLIKSAGSARGGSKQKFGGSKRR